MATHWSIRLAAAPHATIWDAGTRGKPDVLRLVYAAYMRGQSALPEVRASLHTYVAAVRRLLNDAGIDVRIVLAAAPPGYRLTANDIDCDVGRFAAERAAGVPAAAAGRFELASRHLSAALAEWRGRVLEDLPTARSSRRSPRRSGRRTGPPPISPWRRPKSPAAGPTP